MVQSRHLILALNARLCPSFLGMDDLTTECSYASQATWFIDVFGLFFDMLFIGVCMTRHWKMSGRLVQELNAYTVDGGVGS